MGFFETFVQCNRITKHFTRQLSGTVCLIALSTLNYGFDNQGIATSQAMDAYQKQFGDYDPDTDTYAIPGYFLSLLNGLPFIGFALGLVTGSMISERFGRRMTMFLMSCWAICTATILISSRAREQALVGRILNYIYIGMELSVCPVFQAEIVPHQIRGFVVGTYQMSLLIGGIIINSVCRGTSTLDGNKSWQIPLGLFYLVPLCIICGIWFVPESPRWLLLKKRDEKAYESLKRLRGEDADIEEELAILKSTIEQHTEEGTYADLFRGTNLKRTLIACGMNFFIQATGSPFTASYGTIFVKSIGALNPFNFSIAASCGNTIACIIALLIVDRVGRRPLLMFGSVLMLTWLLTMASLGTLENKTLLHKNMIIACLALFQASQSMSWAPLCYIVTTEVCTTSLRDKTQRVASSVNIITSFLVSFTVPYLINDEYAGLQSKVGYIYGGLAVLSLAFGFLCIPETKDTSLETIDRMFMNHVSVRKFKKRAREYVATEQSVEKQEKLTLEIEAVRG